MVVVIALWIALCAYGISFQKNTVLPLNSNHALALRGICAIEIMIGHIGISTGSIWLYPNRKAGILFVGIFFLLSGYGIAYSIENKGNYQKKFLIKRITKLFVPAYLVFIIFTLSDVVLFKAPRPWSIVSLSEFLGSLNWYVWEQLFFYVLFWLVNRLMPRYVELIIIVCSVVFVGIAFVLGIDNPWYGSTLCFALGLCYYKMEKKKCELKRIKWWIVLLGAGVCLGTSMLAFFVLGNDSVVGNPIARNIASVSFCIIILLLLEKIQIGNKVSQFFGKFSYEIFLVHPFVLSRLKRVAIESSLVYALMAIVLTITISYLVHMFLKQCKKVIAKQK